MSWIVAGLVGLVAVAPQIDRAASDPGSEAPESGFAIPRAADGQFYIQGQVGDGQVRFLVDNGIGDVLLTADDAVRLGLDPAAGAVMLPRFAIGDTVVTNARARIAPDLPVSLIGRDFLARAAGAELRRDQLVLR